MKRLASFVAVLVAALCFTAVAFATDPPDDGQNGPSPDPGMVTQSTPVFYVDQDHQEVQCNLNLYAPWHRYYQPWDIWYVQARATASCAYLSGSIWLPYHAPQINLTSVLYKAPPGQGYSQSDIDQSVVYIDSITSVRNVHECDGKVRNTLYLQQAQAVFYAGGQVRTVNASTGGFFITCG